VKTSVAERNSGSRPGGIYERQGRIFDPYDACGGYREVNSVLRITGI
jgi:hypothetical protein